MGVLYPCALGCASVATLPLQVILGRVVWRMVSANLGLLLHVYWSTIIILIIYSVYSWPRIRANWVLNNSVLDITVAIYFKQVTDKLGLGRWGIKWSHLRIVCRPVWHHTVNWLTVRRELPLETEVNICQRVNQITWL